MVQLVYRAGVYGQMSQTFGPAPHALPHSQMPAPQHYPTFGEGRDMDPISGITKMGRLGMTQSAASGGLQAGGIMGGGGQLGKNPARELPG